MENVVHEVETEVAEAVATEAATQGMSVNQLWEVSAVHIVASIIIWIITSIGMAKMFKKAGEKEWKAWVPIVNAYTLYKITWSTSIFWLNALVWAIVGILGGIANTKYPQYTEAANANLSSVPGTLVALLVISVVFILIAAVIHFLAADKISKSYGHGFGYTLGVWLFPPIFTCILGYGASKYVGKNTTA